MKTPYVPHIFGDDVQAKLRSQVGWLTAAVASSIPWPKKDVWIQYGGDDFILRGTQNGEQASAPAITVPCSSQAQIEPALTKVYRLTSVLGWFLTGYVDVVDYIHSSHAMGFGPQMRQAFTTVGQGGDKGFSCNHMPVLVHDNVRIALAFWREGERLTRVHDSFAFLSYFKVIEAQFNSSDKRVEWMNANIELLEGRAAARVVQLRADGADVGKHLWGSGRNAVAHASLGGRIVDPDLPSDRRRIALDLVLMRDLAYRLIHVDLKVPTAMDVYEARDRLAPWDVLLDPAHLAALRAGEAPVETLGLEGKQVAVALWPDAPLPGLDAMTMRVDAVHEGKVRVVMFNMRMTIMLVFVLDYQNGVVHTQLDNGSLLISGAERPGEEDVRAYYMYFHRVIGNAVVELQVSDCEPVDCEVVIPVNIIPRNAAEAVEDAVEAYRRQECQGSIGP